LSILPDCNGIKGRDDMKKRGDSRRFLIVAFALGLLVNAGGKPAFSKDRDVIGSARTTAIHDCNIEADKFSAITQLPNQFAVNGTCIARHVGCPGREVGRTISMHDTCLFH
jgi:hypothetical protein